MIGVDRNAWALDTLGLSLAAMAHIVAQMACLNEEYLARAGSQHSIVSRIAHCALRSAWSPCRHSMLYWQDSKLGAVLTGRHGAIIDAFRGPLRRRSSRLYAFVETSSVLALDGDHQMTCANDSDRR